MKLYQTPHGTWCGTEAAWKAAMKAEGSDPKAATRKLIEVPTDKPGLLEFLTFHNVNVVNPQALPAPEVTGGDMPPSNPPSPSVAPAASTTVPSSVAVLDQVEALPLTAQLDILVDIADRAHKAICRTTPGVVSTAYDDGGA